MFKPEALEPPPANELNAEDVRLSLKEMVNNEKCLLGTQRDCVMLETESLTM